MDHRHLRAILLKLQDRLSDDDRKRLHFFLGNDVPRRIRDDATLGGTLSLIESLFDQDKISEREFTFLINAFDEIECLDAAKLLREHMKRMQTNGINESIQSLATIMPTTLDPLVQDQEVDKYNMQVRHSNQQKNCGDNNQITYINNTKTKPVTITVGHQTTLTLRNKLLKRSSMMYICLSLFVLLLIIALGILTAFYIRKTDRIYRLENDLKMKDDIILKEETKNNETLHTAEQLNNQLKDLEQEKSTWLIKAGKKFGGTGGNPFDDSQTQNFTCSHYLSGIVTRRDFPYLDWIQFLYSTPYDNGGSIENVRGEPRGIETAQRFDLQKDEKINKVQINIFNMTFTTSNPPFSTLIIRGVRFFTTKGRSIQSFKRMDGEMITEHFDGYTLGYATGRSGSNVDQLQFYWYRT